jgi:TRAP-type C4-dicarboxylate transport system permease small subunit
VTGTRLAQWLVQLPKLAVTFLIIVAIANLLAGVLLRYFVGAITDYYDLDPIPYVWVEEVGEMALAWLTLIGAAIGIRQRSHFTVHFLAHRFPPRARRAIETVNHILIAGFGLIVAGFGARLCRLNISLTSPGLEINLAWLYASSVVGGLLIAIYALSMIFKPAPDAPQLQH